MIFGLLALSSVWFLPWRFQVNDDVLMMWLVSGAYTGTPETYAVFIHPILSWIFSGLYGTFPLVNWYAGTWFWTIGFSFILIYKSLQSSSINKQVKHIIFLLILILCIHFCYFLQFTQVAGLGCLAALIYLFGANTNEEKIPALLAFGIFVLSQLIRWEAVALVGMGFLLWKICHSGIDFLQVNKKRLGILGITFLILVGGKSYWESRSQYRDFLEFNNVRAAVIDHPVFRQEVISDGFEKNSDWYFFANWYFEEGFPDIEVLQSKKEELDFRLFSLQEVSNSFIRLFQIQKTEAFKSLLIAVFLFLFFLMYLNNAKARVFALLWFIFFFLFNHFFLIQGRVIVVFFLPFLLTLLDYAGELKGRTLWKAASVILIFAFCIHTYNILKEGKGRKQMDREFLRLSEEIPQGGIVLVEGYHSQNSMILYSLQNPVPFLVTGWIARSPFQKRALQRFGLNAFAEMKTYNLFSIEGQLDIIFPRYANRNFGTFHLVKTSSTKNFILQEFSLHPK